MKYSPAKNHFKLIVTAVVIALLKLAPSGAAETIPQPMEISSGWQLQG